MHIMSCEYYTGVKLKLLLFKSITIVLKNYNIGKDI